MASPTHKWAFLPAALRSHGRYQGWYSGGYVTASAPSTDPGIGAFRLIRFSPQATQDDVTKFLEANKLSIVAGPMAGGLYKVRVAVTGLPKEELATIVKKLQDNKAVAFIAPTK